MYELQQDVKNYERKVEIAERAARLHKAKAKSDATASSSKSSNQELFSGTH
jgi:hypothetical protein